MDSTLSLGSYVSSATPAAALPNHYLFVPTVGTSIGVPAKVIQQARIELEKLKLELGEEEPDRGDLCDPNIKWRQGKPDYTIANLAYFRGKTRSHKAGSLEKTVENLVKTWEMEASHKQDYHQWSTIDHKMYWTQCNNGKKYPGIEGAEMGNYNWLLASCPKALYDSSVESFESSHYYFRTAFPQGFAWEVLEVFSPPPRVAFSWRHWASFTGTYKGNVGKGETVEMTGFVICTLEGMKIVGLEVFYKPEEFLEVLEGKRPANYNRVKILKVEEEQHHRMQQKGKEIQVSKATTT